MNRRYLPCELTANGNNKAIEAHVLDDATMRRVGFTDHVEDRWYFMRVLKRYSISFNVTIDKATREVAIDVLDEDFLQPYNYQAMLSDDPTCQPALDVERFVEEQMACLQDKGILSGHVRGEYI